MNLKELLVKSDVPLQASVEFKDGIVLTLNYINRAKIQALYKTCTIRKYSNDSRRREDTVQPDKFAEEFCVLAVAGWKGLTPRKLASLTPVDLSHLTETQRDEEIPFSRESLIMLVKESHEIDTFIQDNCVDAKLFSPNQEAEIKNSETSQSGN